ncbi:necrosis inducing protein [Aspergillus bertholletiae]|uniref:Necrosis inducing protein n=1 Tax=Aspergillus bertholletiae TaxID=1226010 RepID=A0A5N7BBF3_9EURO|nr:necrosis inducing protein [Aspergillus bertholletiae]
MVSKLLFFTAALLQLAQGGLIRREFIDHDKVVGFPETVPSGVTGDVYKAYQPLLKVVNGCVPFPAVDAQGNLNAGLAITGASNGGCSKSTGQVYVRGGQSGDKYALMYSWYFPKDEASPEMGHRHDWEGVIVWISDPAKTSADNILAVCPSGHGKWDCSKNGYTLSETRPQIKYYSIWPINHQCGLTDETGGSQPLIAYESLPAPAKAALESANFDKANVPFKEENWAANLGKATF